MSIRKKTNKLVILFLINILVTFSASVSAAIINVLPASPTTSDFLVANVSGSYGAAGYSLLYSQTLYYPDNTINIDLFIDSPEISASVISYYSYDIDLGFLDKGSYSISADFYFDGIQKLTVSNNFEVSSVPVPAAVWLFFTGLLSISSFGWFNKKA